VTTLAPVDPTEWRLEVERVTPLLKVTLANDNKDWRIHLQQMKALEQVLGNFLVLECFLYLLTQRVDNLDDPC
jgi:hypothetical protein